jgi:hypothetical protein
VILELGHRIAKESGEIPSIGKGLAVVPWSLVKLRA